MSSRCGAVIVEGAGAVKVGRQRGVDAEAQRLQQVLDAQYCPPPTPG
jgi:hypothetical protein